MCVNNKVINVQFVCIINLTEIRKKKKKDQIGKKGKTPPQKEGVVRGKKRKKNEVKDVSTMKKGNVQGSGSERKEGHKGKINNSQAMSTSSAGERRQGNR